MSSFPHYFGLDFTGAGPWLLAGFLAGLFLSWIWGALRGSRIRAQTEAKIQQVEALLDASRSEHQADVSRLLGDARNFEQALADAERRAAAHSQTAARLSSENDTLSKAELASRNELLAADAELAKQRSGLQWAQSQAQGAAQDRQALEQQIIRYRSEQQAFTSELATAKTALELKDAEIVRLINHSQWHESRASALEKEKLGLTTNLSALSGKDAELTRVAGELEAARAELGRSQQAFAAHQSGGAEAVAAAQAKYDTAWKELTYVRDLASWATREIDRLRKAIAQFESDVAAKASAMASLAQQHAVLKTKLSKSFPGSRRKGRSLLGSGGVNGMAPSAGDTKIAYLVPRQSSSAGRKRAKAYKLGKAIAAAGPAGQARARGRHGTSAARSMAASRVAFSELQSLKAKVATLSEDAANYRRLRDALDTANRIAGTNV